jgi:hypothetical protein
LLSPFLIYYYNYGSEDVLLFLLLGFNIIATIAINPYHDLHGHDHDVTRGIIGTWGARSWPGFRSFTGSVALIGLFIHGVWRRRGFSAGAISQVSFNQLKQKEGCLIAQPSTIIAR